ncbi:FAD-dependent monooxygenase [bacterium]|nr:FAD-dependent monooxygenase [bacterium]
MKDKKIAIVGGGLAGSLISVMLGQRGYDVTVYEKRPDMRTREVDAGRSINLALAQRGIKALSAAGLMDDVEPLLIPMRGRQLHLPGGKQEFSPYGQREHEVIYSVSRERLNSLMLTASEQHELVNVVFEQECQTIDFAKKQISFRDLNNGADNVVDYDLLIGCDGAGSRVRRQLMPLVNGSSSSEILDHDYKELTIPAGKDSQHLIKKEALHIWPRGGYMLIALPNLDGSFTVTLFMPKQGEPSFESLNDVDSVTKFFASQFPTAMELIPDLAKEFFENPTGLLGTLRCEPWSYDDSVVILGDASHAIVPFHGQGMNAAFEDCDEFCQLLDGFEHDWEKTIAEFGAVRKPHADAIADMALENYITMRDSVMDEQFQLKKEVGFELERKYPTRFTPRYSMVMFHSIGYAEALTRGKIQDELLTELTRGKDSCDTVDWELAARMVEERLLPVVLD